MRRVLLILLVAAMLVVAAIVGMVAHLAGHPGPDVHKPRGYEQIAAIFLRHRWLTYEDNPTRVSLDARAGAAAKRVFRRSFLMGDVEEFNGGQSWIFKIENQQVRGVDATRHNVLLPYGAVENWDGTLRYRPSGTLEASLRGVGIDIEIQGLTRPVLEQTSPEEVTIRGDLNPEPVSRARGEIVNVFGRAPRSTVYLGKVHLAGENIIVNNRNSPASVSMTISGNRLAQGNRAWLAPGDLLKLEWRAGQLSRSRYALLWSEGGRSADVISAPCAINGRWTRCPEEPSLSLATEVIASLDAGVAGRASRGRNDFDVVMTLDRGLHHDVQAALERNRRQPPGAPVDETAARRRAMRAAVTVMDAMSGEILALASYPTRSALARVDLPPSAEARLLRNHNFSRMPIGSVAKVLLSAAIFDADPRLSTLQLRQHGGLSVDTVAGIHVDPPIESHPVNAGDDGLVGFHEFIKHSSNEYAALLLTLASATKAGDPLPTFTGPPLRAEGRYSISGQQFDRAPSPTAREETRLNLGRGRRGTIVSGTLSNLEGEAWGESFGRLFDVDKIVSTPIDARAAVQGDQVIDTSVWQPVLDELYGTDVPENHPLRAVGFERENLALNLSHVYRTQLLSMMYGGATARFTNPKLSEMFSRLVTGRRVERALVLGVTPSGEELPRTPRQFQPLSFDPALRGQLLEAMAAVAHGGTANSMYDSLVRIDRTLAQQQKALGFFSKTGSPRNTIAVPNGLGRAVNALISSGAVALNAQGVLTYRGIPLTEDSERGGLPPSLQALIANAPDRTVLRRNGVGPRLVHDVLLLYNIEPADRRERLFVVRNGRLYSMQQAVREISATGAVYVFTLAVYDAAARRSDQPLDVDAVNHAPLRAWTVAITIEGQGKSTDVAVPFAETLLNDVLWPAIQEAVER
ncbi:MAG: hypothetical protein M3P06_03005 [Acidobacteriota bacterium]|nr:hypothetical protein [Acidobacteriota bacterium]